MGTTEEFNKKYDQMMDDCRTRKAKVLYEGLSSVYVMSYYRKWEDLFPVEREEIFKVMENADEAWWGQLGIIMKERKEQRERSRVEE